MGNNLSSHNKEDKRALAAAITNHDVDTARAIVRKDVTILLSRLDKKTGNTAIHTAVSIGDQAVLSALLDFAQRYVTEPHHL